MLRRIYTFSVYRRFSMKRSITTAEAKDKNLITKCSRKDIMLGQASRVRTQPAIKSLESSPEFQSIFTDELRALISLFKKYNYELRVAGGAVRDILMKITPKDIDLATTATPHQMKEMFNQEEVRMINTKGEKHGTITPRIHDKENFEVTTLRIDVCTDGRHAEVQFTTDWQLDANRRDLTINSMFLDFNGILYDYFFGYEDLQERRVVFVGNAASRIREDYLRILRYFRFYGRISNKPNNHDEDTLNAIKDNVEGLNKISGERIWVELQKILIGNFGDVLMEEILRCGMASYLGFPNKPNIEEFQRLHKVLQTFPEVHHPILFAIALLHSQEDAIRLHERLKLSAFERDLAFFITQQRKKVDDEYQTLLNYQILCLQPNVRRDFVENLLKYMGKFDMYNTFKTWQCPHFPLNGNILKEHGCPQGKLMGKIMTHLKLIWAESDFAISKDELLSVHLPIALKKLKSQ